jgi:transposase
MIPHFYGFDIHQKYVVVAAVDAEQEMLLEPTRIEMPELEVWAAHTLTTADQAVLEAGTNTWYVVDRLTPHAGKVVVANPYKTKLIAEAYIKNDKVDAKTLARLLAARFICDVWVPQDQVREQRTLAAHRASLQKRCTQAKNALHNMLHRRSQRCPERSLFSSAGRQWLLDLPLPEADRLRIHHLLRQLELLEQEIDETDRLIARQAAQDARIPRLMQICGVGYYTAFAILAFIGNVQRFPSADKLSAYAGLVPRQYQSGNHGFHGHITKAGNPLLRWLMVEAARAAVRFDPHWRQEHDRIARRRGTNIATVAVARKLLVTIWHLLTNQSVYYYLRPQTFVTKLQDWAFRIGRNHLPAVDSKEFVRSHLEALGLQRLADSLSYKGRNYRLSVQSP